MERWPPEGRATDQWRMEWGPSRTTDGDVAEVDNSRTDAGRPGWATEPWVRLKIRLFIRPVLPQQVGDGGRWRPTGTCDRAVAQAGGTAANR